MRVLDLFSGLGGFSEAFVRAGDEVVRVENNPLLSEVPHTSMQNVLEVRDRLREFADRGEPIRKYDVLLAGPPCREFSLAYASPRSIASRQGEEFEPDLTLLEATLEIIKITKPRVWVIENVVGSAEYFARAGLTVRQQHGPHQLYGNFPMFECGPLPTKASKDKTSTDPLRANHKALIPIELSTQLRRAIVEQKTLYCDYGVS
jgi:hypothetical protein